MLWSEFFFLADSGMSMNYLKLKAESKSSIFWLRYMEKDTSLFLQQQLAVVPAKAVTVGEYFTKQGELLSLLTQGGRTY